MRIRSNYRNSVNRRNINVHITKIWPKLSAADQRRRRGSMRGKEDQRSQKFPSPTNICGQQIRFFCDFSKAGVPKINLQIRTRLTVRYILHLEDSCGHKRQFSKEDSTPITLPLQIILKSRCHISHKTRAYLQIQFGQKKLTLKIDPLSCDSLTTAGTNHKPDD